MVKRTAMETKLPGTEDREQQKLTINNAIKNELKKVAAF